MMRAILGKISSGDFLGEMRLFRYAIITIAFYALFSMGYLAFAGWTVPSGAPVGTDFVSFWSAAKSAWSGNASLPYNPVLFQQIETELFPNTPFFAYFYPPIFLLYLMPLGALGYFPALAIWICGTFVLVTFTIYSIVRRARLSALIVLSFPATFINAIHGQNAFLTAALLGAGSMMLERSQIISGILFGLLAYKPQFGILIPVALFAGGYWAAVISAATTIGVLIAISTAMFGVSAWTAFFNQTAFATATLHEGFVSWNKMVSLYGMLRSAGLPDAVAMAAQVVLAVLAGLAIAWVWRRKAPLETRVPLLIIGAVIASPFALTYDYFIALPALVLITARGFLSGFWPYEKSFLFLTFVFPLIGSILALTAVRFDVIVLSVLFSLVFRHYLAAGRSGSGQAAGISSWRQVR